MVVTLIHADILKVLEQTKLGRDVTIWGGEGQVHLHQASNLTDVGEKVTTNSGILKKIKLLEPIRHHNIGGGLSVEGVGAIDGIYPFSITTK